MRRARFCRLFAALAIGLVVATFVVSCSPGSVVGVYYTVSGRITQDGVGLGGVSLLFSGGYGIAVTDAHGLWSKSGLRGTVAVTPSKAGYAFSPTSRQVSGPDNSVSFRGTLLQAGDLEGYVYLADWDVGLINATVTDIGTGKTTTTDDDGYFVLRQLPYGQRQIAVDTLFASTSATVQVYAGQTSSLNVRVPFNLVTFEYFDKLVQQIDDPNGKAKDGTRRWPVGKSISVYFDTVNTPVGYTPAHREIAWSAVSTWPTLIGGDVISVHEVYFASAADVTVHWVPSGSLGANTIGLCTYSYNDDFEITKAKLQLDVYYTDGLLLSLAVHEFGHTLHLGHSPVRGDIMYYQLQTGVTAPSDQEIEATRILYSLPTKIKLEDPMRSGGARVVRVQGGAGEVTEAVVLDLASDGPFSDDFSDGLGEGLSYDGLGDDGFSED